jgi:hypothetical protein
MDLKIIINETNQPSEKALQEFNQYVFDVVQKNQQENKSEQERGEAI